MRVYGTGNLWLRKSKRHANGEYWLRYRDTAGRQRTENSHFCLCHDGRAESNAERLLSKRIGEVETGTLLGPKANRTLVSDLAEALFTSQRAALLRKIPENLPGPTREWRAKQAERILKEQKGRWNKHPEPVFGNRKAALVTAQDLQQYQTDRLDAKKKARYATINRELQLLRRAFRLGFEARPKLVPDIPKFPARLAESPRKGFIEDAVFAKLLAAIEEPGLRGLVLTAFRLGFRKSELQNLLCLQLADGWLRLFAGATKNGKPRAVKLPDDVNEALTACARGEGPHAFLFTWPDGSAIKDFRGAWLKATKAAGVPKLMFHDLRRSAVRRIRRKGVPTSTAMLITGHLTRMVFDEYDAANAEDVSEAAKIL
jgi:integrase